MPQENQVLRCYNCKMFQVHIVRKDKKWQCKMCNSKQSLVRVYGKGTGKDCRLHVMKLNKFQFSGCSPDSPQSINVVEETGECLNDPVPADCNQSKKTGSKWSAYIDEKKITQDKEEYEIEQTMVRDKISYGKNKRIKDSNTSVKNSKKFKLNEQSFEIFENFENMNCGNDLIKSCKMKCEKAKVRKSNEIPLSCFQPVSSKSKWSAYVFNEKELEESKKENESEFLKVIEKQRDKTNKRDMDPKINTDQPYLFDLDICRKESISTENTLSDRMGKFQPLELTAKNDGLIIFQNHTDEENLDDILDF